MRNSTRLVAIALVMICSTVAGVVAVTSPDPDPEPARVRKCTAILQPGSSC